MTERNERDVPMSVIDKFMALSQENNQSYSQIVNVLDTLSANVADMRDSVLRLDDQITEENLGQVVTLCTENIQSQVEEISTLVTQVRDFHYSMQDSGLLPALESYLKVNNVKPSEFAIMVVGHLEAPTSLKSNKDTLEWVLGTATAIRNNWGKLMVAMGATLMFIYVNGGKTLMDIITKFK